MQRCPTCHREHVIKHGSVTGKPHKRWKPCGYQCTRPRRHRKPLTMQINTVLLSLSGGADAPHCLPPPRVGAVGAQWVRAFAQKHYEQPEPTRRAIVLERDERWHSLKKKRRKLWIWKSWIVIPATASIGHVGGGTKLR